MMGAIQSYVSSGGAAHLPDLPFLNDDETVHYLAGSKTLILLCCMAPGNEESTLAKAICDKYPGKAVVCSACEHHEEQKEQEEDECPSRPVKEDAKEVQHGYLECIEKSCCEGVPIVVVDRVCPVLDDIQKCGEIGKKFSYVELLVDMESPLSTDAKEAKLGKLQNPPYPLFYGWFVNEKDSRVLRSVGQDFYKKCLANEKFRNEFVKNLIPLPGQEKPDPDYYFSSEDYTVGPLLLHCTAFYSNYGDVTQSAEYAGREAVRSGNGRAFTLSIIGLIVTPRSLGFRLKLSEGELPVWFEEENELAQSRGDGNGMESSVDAECIISPFSPTCGTGSRAHFSLGSGPGVEPVQTGLDLVEIIQLEQQAARLGGEGFTVIGLDGGMAVGYGKGNWMVLFDEPRSVETLFSKFY